MRFVICVARHAAWNTGKRSRSGWFGR